MANDKNPTEQLRTRMPATHSERNDVSSGIEASGNPWEALQNRREAQWNPHDHWLPRPHRYNVPDAAYVLVLLGIGAVIIGLVLLLT